MSAIVMHVSGSRAGAENMIIDSCLSEQSATCIQARMRGIFSRRSLPPQFCFEQQCGKLMRVKGDIVHTTATDDKTPVWFPELCPGVVMKFSGRSSHLRLAVMKDIRQVLQAQKSSHVIVPIARACERDGRAILIEERLPINTDQYYNMWLYLHNRKAFDDPVRELVRLYLETGGIGDLKGSNGHPLMQLEKMGYGIRFDNFPLYLNRKGEGCVGLVDLEHIGNETFFSGCQTLARIFPFHIDLIIEESEKCGYPLERDSLKSHEEEGKQALEVGIWKHENWLWDKIKKQIPSRSAFNPIAALPRERKIKLIALVKQMLLNSHEKEGTLESSNCYIIIDTPMVPMNPTSLSQELLYNPLDRKLDIEWMLHPKIDLAHPEISADTLATGITLFILQYFANALPDDHILSFKTCKRGTEWAVIRSRSPTIKTVGFFSTIELMIGTYQRYIVSRFVDVEEMYFPCIRPVDIVDIIMTDLISYGDIFSCGIISDGRYWLRY